ncbi:peptide chain release factor N(5)-glutamine methyltransferase [Nesterenkonia natronophila]|uniref:Release factor glutamine methyltransferase n=1 Tax=Nesterenkonia natronophila TaxID=2174932 RepID=A0A3A4EZQ5_9MICC|nr:peptide chain release factor N(5)-glutamine methyltransferase [Nesterenkonia natronophila]RJN31402.1 peptide chain release factor N(5)-glutamine methyltransferase [Nesterenkonia natronophila]
MDLLTTLRRAVERLAAAEIPSPQTDAELLAAHAWGISRAELKLQVISGAAEAEAADQIQDRFWELIEERAHRVPLQHLTGVAPFRWLELQVGPGVFVPRPETETVVELVLQKLRALGACGVPNPRVVDLGTGSGAIAASIATEYPAAEVHAVEVSVEAAAWAELNFRQIPNGSSPVVMHLCDLRDFSRQWHTDPANAGALFDVVVSNPPYIPPGMIPVEPEVREHDPEIALYGGGSDGLELPEAVIRAAKHLLVPGGWLILEHAEAHAEALAGLCRADPMLENVETHRDLTDRQRSTSATVKRGCPAGDQRTSESAA